jgi:hypothetical protein
MKPIPKISSDPADICPNPACHVCVTSAVHSGPGEVAGVGEDERSLIRCGHQSDPDEAGNRGWDKSYISYQHPRCAFLLRFRKLEEKQKMFLKFVFK